MKLKIYGSSDDLVEIEGDYREEFNPHSDEWSYLIFSDGTAIKILYTGNGVWKIELIAIGKETVHKFTPCIAENIDETYSDELILEGTFRWVIFATEAQFENIRNK